MTLKSYVYGIKSFMRYEVIIIGKKYNVELWDKKSQLKVNYDMTNLSQLLV